VSVSAALSSFSVINGLQTLVGVLLSASSHPVITSRKSICFRHSCYASSRHSQIAVDDSRYFGIAQFICKCARLNDLQSLLFARDKSQTFVLVLVLNCRSVFEIVLFIIGCAISILVRAITILVFGADFVLWIIIAGVVLRW
jgi:hypothetical protein